MKKIFLVATLLFFFSTRVVSAHFFASDGAIRAIIHIDPQDDPVAGEASTIHIDIVDQENKFTYDDCDCNFTISENNKEIFSRVLERDDMAHMPIISYVFLERNIYQMKLTGLPKTANSFQAFNLNYDIRVEKGITAKPPFVLQIALIVFILLTSIIGFIMLVRYTKK